MKRTLLSLLAIGLFLVATSCREKTTGEKVEDAVESVADDVEDAVD